jgi:hypothetical protein
MIHASHFCPRVTPVFGVGVPAEIDRAQGIDPTATLNREKINEIGRVGTVGYVSKTPSIAYRLTQTEYGNFEFWRKMANVTDTTETITQENFKTSAVDICAFLTDDNGTFRGTMLYPNMRTTGFDLNIGNPDATIERSFNLVGEQAFTYKGAAPYYISLDKTASASGDNTIDCATRVPAIDPDAAVGASDAVKYIYRVVKTRNGISTELVPDVTGGFTYSNATKLVTIDGVEPDDFFRVFYASATAPATLFTNNDVDVAGLNADVVSIYLYVPGSGKPDADDYLYRIQSVSISAAFTRSDLKEIGNKNVVQRGVNETKATVKLGSIMEQFTMEDVLRGVASDFTKLDISKLSSNVSLIVKIYADNTKATLKYGMLLTDLSPTDVGQGAASNQYVKKDATLEGEAFSISTDNAVLQAEYIA